MNVLIKSLAIIAVLVVAGCAASETTEAKEVFITLSDYKISSSLTEFEKGATYRLVVVNAGKDTHELRVMPRGGQDVSKTLFRTGEIKPEGRFEGIFVFPEGGYEFSCHLAQHYGAGMVKTISVS